MIFIGRYRCCNRGRGTQTVIPGNAFEDVGSEPLRCQSTRRRTTLPANGKSPEYYIYIPVYIPYRVNPFARPITGFSRTVPESITIAHMEIGPFQFCRAFRTAQLDN